MLDKTDYSDYYAPTAYDSTKIRRMPPRIPLEKFDYFLRYYRKKLLPWGMFFNDDRVLVTRSMLDELREGKYDNRAGLNEAIFEFGSFRNPMVVVDALRRLMGMFSIIAFFTCAGLTITYPEEASLDIWTIVAIPTILYLIMLFFQKKSPTATITS